MQNKSDKSGNSKVTKRGKGGTKGGSGTLLDTNLVLRGHRKWCQE